MKFISILVGKILIFIGKLCHKGTSLPGQYALKINKNLLKELKVPDKIIAVTGSSGKGSTTSMLAKIFRDQGYTVTHNSSGANLVAGITTTLLKECTLTGKIKSDVIILEVDERYTKFLFKDIKPNVLVITNLCRDQPPRQAHFDAVFNEISKGITDDMTLVLNSDDPYLRKFTLNRPNKVIYYGIDKNKYSYKTNKFKNLNINYCPKCNSKLAYNYYNFENNGDYFCVQCDFKRIKPDYSVTNIDYNSNTIEINKNYKIDLPFNVLFCIYNTLAAFTVSNIFNLDNDKTVKTISNIDKNKKIYNNYNYHNRNVTILNNKAENSSTFNQSLLYIDRYKEEKVIVIGWKEISRRYQYNDMSWLYDVDFELLNNNNVKKIICVGRDCFNIATRIKLTGFNENDIITYKSLEEAVKYTKTKTKGSIYAILNFDYVEPFNDYMIGSDNSEY